MVNQLGEGFWHLIDPGYAQPSSCYLLVGNDRAALIDTGLGMHDLRQCVEQHTSLDVVVLQTHAHPDHAGASHQFDRVMAHPLAVETLQRGWTNDELRFTIERTFKGRDLPPDIVADEFEIPGCATVDAFENRGVVDLGGRQIDVFFTPGHSPDSVCLLDLEAGLLFTGDSVAKTRIAIEDSVAFRRSILDIVRLAELSAGLYPGHGEVPIPPGFARRVHQGFRDAITDRRADRISGRFCDIRV